MVCCFFLIKSFFFILMKLNFIMLKLRGEGFVTNKLFFCYISKLRTKLKLCFKFQHSKSKDYKIEFEEKCIFAFRGRREDLERLPN